MIRIVWAVLCKQIIENKQTSNTTLIESLEKLKIEIRPDFVSQKINIDFPFSLATYWFNDDNVNSDAGTFRLRLITQSGHTTVSLEQAIDLVPHAFKKWYLNFQTMGVDGEGVYFFELHFKEDGKSRWNRVATIPFLIEYKVNPEATLLQSVDPGEDVKLPT